MRKKLLDFVRTGKIDEALKNGEEFLIEMKNFYYSWTLLQSRFEDKKKDNLKGVYLWKTTQMKSIKSMLIYWN